MPPAYRTDVATPPPTRPRTPMCDDPASSSLRRSDSNSRREENVGMEAVAAELKDAATEYRQAEAAKDVLAEVVQPPALKQQFVAYGDRSAPVVEPDVTIKMSPMAELKEELTGPSPEISATPSRSIPLLHAIAISGAPAAGEAAGFATASETTPRTRAMSWKPKLDMHAK